MEGGTPECEYAGVLVNRVILPNGDVKEVKFNGDNLVRQEKERVLRDNEIPYPSLYLMVVYGPRNSYTVMEDTKLIKMYADSLGGGLEYEVHIRNKNSQAERPARPIKPELFNIQLK